MTKSVGFLSSGVLGSALALFFAGLYAYFSLEGPAYGRWEGFVLHSPAGSALYLLFVINIASRVLRHAVGRLRRSADMAVVDAAFMIPASGEGGVDVVTRTIRDKGFVVARVPGGVCGIKGRYSFIPGLLLRLGIALFMTALLVSANIRKTQEVVLRSGSQGEALGKSVRLASLDAGLPDEFLDMGRQSTFALSNLTARLSVGEKEINISGGFPSEAGGIYFRVMHAGLHHEFSINNGASDFFGVGLNLDVLPPGKTASVEIGPGRTTAVRLEPERVITKGLLTGKAYSLRMPLYRLSFNDKTETVVRSGETSTITGGTVSIGEPSVFVRIQAVRDPSLIWIYSGLVMAILGLSLMPLRFFWYEKKMTAMFKDGTLSIGYREEFFKKWGVQRFLAQRGDFVSALGASVNEKNSSQDEKDSSG